MRFNQHIPSIFTLINLFLGFIAITNIQHGNYLIACYILLAAGTFDAIDGKLKMEIIPVCIPVNETIEFNATFAKQ